MTKNNHKRLKTKHSSLVNNEEEISFHEGPYVDEETSRLLDDYINGNLQNSCEEDENSSSYSPRRMSRENYYQENRHHIQNSQPGDNEEEIPNIQYADPYDIYTEQTEDVGNNSDGESVGDDSVQNELFVIKVRYITKEFLSQRTVKTERNPKIERIQCSSVDEFKQKTWPTASQLIKSEAAFRGDTNNYCWSQIQPSIDNMDNFISYQAMNAKRSHSPHKLTTKILQGWKNAPQVLCIVYVYGKLIGSKEEYAQLVKQLITPEDIDRAGASSNLLLFNTMKKLKEIHKHLRSTDESWLRWANYVTAAPTHKYDELLKELPPLNLIQLFRHARNHPQQQLQFMRRSVKLGHRLNNGYKGIIHNLLEDFQELEKLNQQQNRLFNKMKRTIESLYDQMNGNTGLLDGFSESMGPEEDEYGASMFNQIDDMDDMDHIDHSAQPVAETEND